MERLVRKILADLLGHFADAALYTSARNEDADFLARMRVRGSLCSHECSSEPNTNDDPAFGETKKTKRLSLAIGSPAGNRLRGEGVKTDMRGYGLAVSFYLVFTFYAGSPVDAAGARTAATPIPHGTVELLSENSWIGAGHSFYLGMHFQLESGWHVYWVNPGDSGQPPRIQWKLPAGISASPLEWPAPKRLGTSRIVDYGYEDEVTLLVPMQAAGLATKEPAQIGAEVRVLVCREICTPGKAQVSLTLPIRSEQPKPDSRTQELFAAARKALPQTAPGNWKFDMEDEKDSFVLTAHLGYQTKQATFFPLEESQIDNAAPQNPVAAAGGFRLTLRKSDQLLKPIERLRGVLELSPGKAFLIDVPVGKHGAGSSD